jgi:hypothetical protein
MYNWTPLTNEDIKWIGVDFDETIASNSGYPNYTPGLPLEGAVDAIKELSIKHKITIFTARPWSDYQNIEKYCEFYGIPTRRIICGKPLFKFMIDDKAIGFRNNWKEVVKEITAQ